jgi:DNA-binding MarR family transcriptional regulator
MDEDVANLGSRFSAAVVMFHQAAAERLGLTAADSKALDLVQRHQPLSVSQLARLTRLSPSSATGLVDRLEAAGFVRREPAPDDRRKVLVVAAPHPGLVEIFRPLGSAMRRMMRRYSPEELATIQDYVERTIAVLQAQTDRLARTE